MATTKRARTDSGFNCVISKFDILRVKRLKNPGKSFRRFYRFQLAIDAGSRWHAPGSDRQKWFRRQNSGIHIQWNTDIRPGVEKVKGRKFNVTSFISVSARNRQKFSGLQMKALINYLEALVKEKYEHRG